VERVIRLVQAKQAEIAERNVEPEEFSAAPPPACRPDLSCCVPESAGGPVAIELTPANESLVACFRV
jgi:hypothetical protein